MKTKRRKRRGAVVDKAGRLKRARFLAAYGELGNVTAACKEAKIARQSHYNWLNTDKAYAREFEERSVEAVERLEQEARRRAVEGVEEPVFHQGRLAGVWVDAKGNPVPENQISEAARFVPHGVRKFSDVLLIFLLKGAKPETYRERHEFSGPRGAPLVPPRIEFYLPANPRDEESGE